MEIKGTAVIAIRDYVRNNHSEHYSKWVNSLELESKKIFDGVIDSTGWYPLEYGAVDPTLKMSELFFGGDFKKGAWEAGRYSAMKALTGIYKIFVKASSPGYIVSRATRIFATYYQPSKMTIVERKDKLVVLEISEMDTCHDVVKYRIGGWIQNAIEISGAKEVNVFFEEEVIDNKDVVKINLTWD
ncbi:MAG: hypothetical protein MI922_04705 [Bacteroidales bacterium]|nr:hypothetical protein [Bacteroidales bacterium]